MTQPESLKSPTQKYRLIEKGKLAHSLYGITLIGADSATPNVIEFFIGSA